MGPDCSAASDSPPNNTTRPNLPLAEDTGRIHTSEDKEQKQPIEIRVPDQAYPAVSATNTESAAIVKTPSNTPTPPHSIRSLQGLEKRGEIAISPGETTDTWQGVLKNQLVAIRAFRIYPSQDLIEAQCILRKLTPSWEGMKHKNVLPFYGIDTSVFPLALVYGWCENGNVMQYLKSNPNGQRPELLLQVARGLQHIHSFGIIHGNLRGASVLISGSGTALIADYGLGPIASNPIFSTTATTGAEAPLPWLAPEIIVPADDTDLNPPTESTSADIFAFAMLTLEVFTGRVPFHGMKNGLILDQIVKGMRPTKPQETESLGFTTEMWKYTEKCWNQDPTQRPNIDEVVCTWECFVDENVFLFLLRSPTSNISHPVCCHTSESRSLEIHTPKPSTKTRRNTTASLIAEYNLP